MRTIFFSVIIGIFLPVYSLARTALSPNLISAREKILNLNFRHADYFILTEQHINPGNKYIDYIRSYGYFVKSLTSTGNDNRELFLESSDKALSQLQNIPATNSLNRAYITELYFMRAAVLYQQGNYLRMGVNLIRAVDLIENNLVYYYNQPEHYRSFAFYHLAISLLPDEYKTLVGVCGYSGSLEKGMNFLEQYFQSSLASGDSVEPVIFKALALNSCTDDSEAAITFIESYPGLIKSKILLRFVYSLILLRNNQSEKVLSLLENTHSNVEKIPYFDYIQGTALLYKADPQCQFYFQRLLKNQPDNDFRILTLQKLFWFYAVTGQKNAAEETKKQIYSSEHGMVLDKIYSGNYNSPQAMLLLKARLYFDGGYYSEAENILEKINPASINDTLLNLEFLYRKARIYQKQMRYGKSELLFNQVIAKGKSIKHYYAAFSALQIAIMAENEGRKKDAEQFYHIALNINSSEYQYYISRRSNAGLSRLRQ